MSEYDSILKKKKKVEEVVVEEKKFPSFWVSLFLILVVLVVSYIIYFNKVLSSKNILIYDYLSVLDRYSFIVDNIPIDQYNNEKNIVGVINYGSDRYDFNLVTNKKNDNINFNISNNDKYINYYLLDGKSYVKVAAIDKYVELNKSFSINTLFKMADILNGISNEKGIKNIYFDDGKPIVEVNMTFNTNDINQMLDLGLVDDYEVIVTLKNSAIMNNIEEVKMVINNKTLDDRRVITIVDNNIVYVDGSNTYNMNLEVNDNNFILKINKNDILYSVLNGNDSGDRYQYNYKIVDEDYNISVSTIKSESDYDYAFNSNRGELKETMDIHLRMDDTYLIETDTTNVVSVTDEVIANTYNSEINYFKDKLLKFIK